MIGRLNAALERLGTAGVLAIGLLIFDAALLVSGILPLRERLAGEAHRVRAAESRLAATHASETGTGDPLEQLLAVFPRSEQIPDEIERLFDLARDQNLRLVKGSYRMDRESGLLEVYRVDLPIEGTYAQVRGFVATALNAMPYLSLDAIRFERRHVGDSSVESQVRFSLFIRKSDGAGGHDSATE